MAQPEHRLYGTTSDPSEFVAVAEQATNSYDLAAALDLYADDATVEVIADGAREVVTGAEQIEQSLTAFTTPLQQSGYAVEKTLLCAGPGLIVNEWRGRFGDGSDRSLGVETWRFDESGKVREHRLLAFFDVRPATSPISGIRLALGRPRLAVRLLKARLRADRGSSKRSS